MATELSPSCILAKTDKGRQEVILRSGLLNSRVRILLIMINGQQTIAEMLPAITSVNLSINDLYELYEQGFVIEKSDEPIDEAENHKKKRTDSFGAAYALMTEVVGGALGVFSLALQLKIERATTLEGLESLQQVIVEHYKKNKKADMANFIQIQLGQIFASRK